MSNKCLYFDKGFCKLKNACTKKHPSQDCDGQCEDKISCPYRHRVECKNKRSCIFVKSNSCEFLHTETWEEELQISEEETLRTIHDGYGARINDLEKQIVDLYRVKEESAIKINDTGKNLFHHIMCLEAKVLVLENKFKKNVNTNNESNVITEKNETQINILKEESKSEAIYKRNELNCTICDKVFKTESNLLNHDKKCHIRKGTTTYKCDNCNEKLATKVELENHISKEHITCTLCKKIFPTITSLNIHITAVHDKLKTKHQIEKEPSLRTNKFSKIMVERI